jgi:hypothetical protein
MSTQHSDDCTLQTTSGTPKTDDCTTCAVSTPAAVSAASIGKVSVRFIGCDAEDEVLLVEVAPDAFQWIFAGSPALPASDLFTSDKAAWAWAWRSWSRQIQTAENFPLAA